MIIKKITSILLSIILILSLTFTVQAKEPSKNFIIGNKDKVNLKSYLTIHQKPDINKKELIIYTKKDKNNVSEDINEETEEQLPYICDMNYFACCVYAEAGNQNETGIRLVIDCILNRADKNGMSIEDVINEPNQFQVVTNNQINKVQPTDDIYNYIVEEMYDRYNTEVLYFRTQHYHSFAIPVIHIQDHYFSK